MKFYTLDEAQDKILGKKGTPERDKFEYELQMEMIGKAIKKSRIECHMTQEELGNLVGVQKARISRIENNAGKTSFDILIRVFNALKAKVNLHVELPNSNTINFVGNSILH